MSVALFAGSFDPPTLGHLDIIERASVICKRVYISIAQNHEKKHPCFSIEERVHFLKAITQHLDRVEITVTEGLISTYAKKNKIDFLIRGLRAFSDMQYEFQMALANKNIGNIETLFLMADSRYSHISSSLIREIAAEGHHLKDFIPEAIESEVRGRLSIAR